MKILSVYHNLITDKKVRRINQTFMTQSVPLVQKCDTISFGRVAENAGHMRRMFKYGMIDIHTEQFLIDPDYFQKLLQNGTFTRSIKSISKIIKPMESWLHPVEYEIFKRMEKRAEQKPLLRLSDFIKELLPQAQKELSDLQEPIFNNLKTLSKHMPQKQKEAFDELMQRTDKQLHNKKIVFKFSKKDFRYKLERINEGIESRGIPDEIKTMEKLIKMSASLPYIPSGRNFLRRKPKFDADKSLKQVNIIRQMDNYFERSCLKNDSELIELFNNVKLQVFNIPTAIPFSRLVFKHQLESIVDTLADKKLAHKMLKEARKLPTMYEEVSAFIVKSSRNSSEKIGHDLLWGQVGAIDHIDTYKDGGADTPENYAFTSNYMNSKRGSKHISTWMKENPKTYTGSQKCVDRFVELQQKGILEKENFSPWNIVNFAKKMYKFSPADKRLNLDLSGLSLKS